jgi:hypothetical protein
VWTSFNVHGMPLKTRVLQLASELEDWAEMLALSASTEVRTELDRRIDEVQRRTETNNDDDWRRTLAKL